MTDVLTFSDEDTAQAVENETPQSLIVHAGATIAPAGAQGAAEGGVIDAAALFPDDEYDDVDPLPEGVFEMMADKRTPFYVVSVAPRESKHGQMWRVVLSLDEGQLFTVVFGYDPTYRNRNEKLASIAWALQNGAQAVGPFRFTLGQENERGNRFKSLAAIKDRPALGKGKK